MHETSAAAVNAVGPERPTDRELKPESHAELLSDRVTAAPLVRILKRPQLSDTIFDFVQADREAQVAQAYYKRWARISAIASFVAVVLASFMLLPRAGVGDDVITLAVVVQFVLLAVSLLASLWLGWRKPFSTWMRKRAEAENARMALFKSVTEADEPVHEGELPLMPLQLEYFRRFQLDVQRFYYDRRGKEHRRALWWRFAWRCAALALIAAALIPIVWTLQGKDWVPIWVTQWLAPVPPKTELGQRLFLSLGLIGGALQGLLAAYSLMSYDERNATRYRDTWKNLEDLASRPLDEAREAAVIGDRNRVLAFIALVHDQVSSEHREWITLVSLVPDLSLDRLRDLRLPMVR